LNIVFDLGGVVFDWQPDTIINSLFDDADTRSLIKKEVFGHADWLELDRGTLALEQAIERGAMRTGLPGQDIERVIAAVPRFLTPIQGTIDLILSLSATDNRLFVLSNMHHETIAYLEAQHDFWEVFDGVVISCRIQMVKPEAQIYQYLLNEFRLDAAETIFIDDMPENLAAASAAGIQTIRFTDPAQCERDLAHFR
jgi:putative hydrolase of the HAD superfamily